MGGALKLMTGCPLSEAASLVCSESLFVIHVSYHPDVVVVDAFEL
jgi:hypothetical protein